MKSLLKRFSFEAGISLIELIVVIVLLSLAMTGITSVLISSMRAQQKVDAQFRSQLDARQVLYDMESNIAEAKREDSLGNQPVFQDDLISFPSQSAGKWITYTYATLPGASQPTIIRLITDGKPAIPPVLTASDKQMIVIGSNGGQTTLADRVNNGPIFTYFGDDGSQIMPNPGTGSVTTPRSVRSVKVSFETTTSEGHADRQPAISTTQVNLRNFQG